MEQDMDMEVEEVFVVHEIDLDYEYDAPRYFDFSREEADAEARAAELWFDSAKSYPPSPFVVKLIMRDDALLKNVNISPKSKALESTSDVDNMETGCDEPARDCNGVIKGKGMSTKVLSENFQWIENRPPGFCEAKAKARTSVKPYLPRTSTLMNPTKSILAKQNQISVVGNSRFQVQQGHISGKSLCGFSCGEGQAAKRQKLEGGHSRKVVEAKQQNNFVHKAPKKDETIVKNPHARLRLTIPREPELETAQRAQRMRPRNISDVEQSMVTVRGFRARPFNRKIFEAPSMPLRKRSVPRVPEFQVFRLKTLERAMEHTSGSSSSLMHCSDSDKELLKSSSVAGKGPRSPDGLTDVNASRQDGVGSIYTFKAHPLNKKIFSSKGDIGVFRNKKQEATVPMEFKLNTEKRTQHNPPIELFSKLSLKSELQPSNGCHSQIRKPQHPHVSMKGSKENRFNHLQQNLEVTKTIKEKTQPGGKLLQYGSEVGIKEAGPRFSMRSPGIR